MIRPAIALSALALVIGAPAWGGPVAPPPERAALAPGVGRIPVRPPALNALADQRRFNRRRACVEISRIEGATVLGERVIVLSLSGGEMVHMRFAQDCPFLEFYQGFYYRPPLGGRLCAGRDHVMARSGGECAIDELARPRARRRR